MRSRQAVLVLVLAWVASCKDSTGTTPPQTLEEASRAFDEAIVRVGWAQQDLWRLGGRDIVVSVQLDSSLAPQYFRLPRRAAR
jgi:hypothetical protein